MRIAVIGAGVAGLVCALRATEAGVDCDVYERWPGLGGQAATLDLGDGVRIERYYHYLFTSDRHMVSLFEELGLGADLEEHPSSSAIVTRGRVWPFNGALDLLRFGPLPLPTRIRMGAALLRMQLGSKGVEAYERETAKDWIERHMGHAAWAEVWGPLMRGKFGERSERISMAWIWDKATRRRNLKSGEARQEVFLHPRRSFEPLFVELERRIAGNGGRVMINRPAARLTRHEGRLAVLPGAPDSFRSGLDPRRFQADGPPATYDAIVACVPNDVFHALLAPDLAEEAGSEYLARLDSIEYFTALNLLLELDRPLTSHFWVNVADRRSPFVGLIEHTNFVGRRNTGGRVFSHVTNYLPEGHQLLGLEPDDLLDRYLPGLRLIDPGFDLSRVRNRWLFREPAGQPIVDVGYPQRIPPRQTPVPGLLLVNTTQIYPEDRGTNYAVRDGAAAAAEAIAAISA